MGIEFVSCNDHFIYFTAIINEGLILSLVMLSMARKKEKGGQVIIIIIINVGIVLLHYKKWRQAPDRP